jgi:aspartate/methionine/tyrosine aminotransferase
MCDEYPRAVSLAGLSKTHAVPGLRLGWLATQDRALLERWSAFKDYTTICHSAPSEALGLMAVRASAALLRRNLDLVRSNLLAAETFFRRHAGLFEWLPPAAGPVAFPRWLGPGSVEALCQAALDREGLMIVPGSIFDQPGPHFRVGLGRANFPAALEHLDALLEDYPVG